MKKVLFLSVGLTALLLQSASAALLESWENTLDGWSLYYPNFTSSFSASTGVTVGNYSLALTGPAPVNSPPLYLILSAYQSNFTTTLAASSALTLDVYTPPGSFGYYLDTQIDIINADTGFVTLGNINFLPTTIGFETTLSFSIPSATAAILAASSNPTQIGIQAVGGFSEGNETVYLDNLQSVPVPEPRVFDLVGLGAAGLLAMRLRLKMWPNQIR